MGKGVTIYELKTILAMQDEPTLSRWHSIWLEKLKTISALALEALEARNGSEVAKSANAVAPQRMIKQ